MDDREKFSETSLRAKEDFYSHLNMKYITDGDYTNAKIVRKDFQVMHVSWSQCPKWYKWYC